jgi:hypothetical protein
MPIQGLPYLRAKCIFVAAMEPPTSTVRQIRIVCLMENEKQIVRQLSSRGISAEEEPTVFPAEEAR